MFKLFSSYFRIISSYFQIIFELFSNYFQVIFKLCSEMAQWQTMSKTEERDMAMAVHMQAQGQEQVVAMAPDVRVAYVHTFSPPS